MQKKVLVASVHPPFGELLRLSLEERGGYSVRLVTTCEYARYEAGKNRYDLLVIDVDRKDGSAETTLPDLNQRFSRLPLIVFPPDNNPKHPLLRGVRFNAWLKKPYYLPDLLAAAEAALNGRTWTLEEGLAGPPEWAWLRESLAGGSRLGSLLKAECLAAVFITRGGVVAARTEGLPEAAGAEIAAMVSRIWREGQSSDLARPVRRGSAGAQALLYVTRIEKSLLAAFLFSSDTSPAQARGLAARIREALPVLRQELAPKYPGLVDEAALEIGDSAPDLPPEEVEGLDARLFELLESAPSPDPFRIDAHDKGDWKLTSESALSGLEDFTFEWEKSRSAATGALKREPARSDAPEKPTAALPPRPAAAAPAPPAPQPPSRPVSQPPSSAARTAAPPAPQPPTEAAPQPPPPASAPAVQIDLTGKKQVFTCALIPNSPEHSLGGQMAEVLREWAAATCAASGWRTVNLQITAAAFQWTLEAPAADSPGALMRIIRQQSSLEIIAHFPQFSLSGEEGDFWAPGFLIVRGSKPPTAQQLVDFIRQTRLRQGLMPE